jgi:capsular polysaccharide biosynthesis protein
MLSMRNRDHLPERLWAYDDYTEFAEQPADSSIGLTSLGFIRAALRRRAWVWRCMAVAGMLIGFGVAAKLPVVYQASTSLLVTPMSTGGENAGAPITNEQAIAQSRTVAELAMSKLGLRESVSSFLASYTVTATTDRVLVITVSAKSSADAVSRANALATKYLQFRTQLLQTQQQLLFRSLDQQVNAELARVDSITNKTARTQATEALTQLEAQVDQTKQTTQQTNDQILQGSRQLDPAGPIPPHSRLKRAIEYTLLGLVAGLALGLGMVVIGALLSDRLRRRDDVAHALGAAVKLSVGTVRGRRLTAVADATENAEVQRIAAYLGKAVPSARRGTASLAVIPVDDFHVPAACLVSLAVSRARQGSRVVLADLCDGVPAAGLLGSADPGVWTVAVDGAQLTVVIPARDDVAPVGPLQGSLGQPRVSEPLAAAFASADLLLTLAALDPSLGGDHLGGWAHRAVAMVTAGQSSAVRIRAVSEMVRLAGTSLISGVLIGADKTDESFGVTPRLTPDADRGALAGENLNPRVKDFFAVDDGPGGSR